MKKMILSTLILAGFAAQAAPGADQYKVVLSCRSLYAAIDNNVEVLLLEGGLAGGITLRVSRSKFVGLSETNYFVKKQQPPEGMDGAPVVYAGKGVKLSVNYTTAPIGNGHYGRLSQKNVGGGTLTDELVCNPGE